MGGCNEVEGDPATKEKKKKKQTKTNPSASKRDQQISITLGEPEDFDVKILTIGAGESGKSTLLRHIEILYGGGITEDQRNEIKIAIRTNIISDIKQLISALNRTNQSVDPTLSTSISLIEEISIQEDELVPDVASSVTDIWNDPTMKVIYQDANMNEFSGYFFDNVERIADQNYVPTDEDILKSRIRTIGSKEYYFNFNTTKVMIFDVGGQKSERNKWQSLFQDVSYILFVVSLSDFDQFLNEEETIRRTQDAITLFSQIASADMFLDTPIFLVLNKKDSFQTKLQKIPEKFKEAYPGFVGDTKDTESAIEHVKQAFLKQLSSRADKGWIEVVSISAINTDSLKEMVQKIAKKIVSNSSK